MKRISVLLISTVLLATLFSCSKEDQDPGTDKTTTTWTVDGKSYSVNNIDRNTAGGTFQLVVYADNYIQVNFPTTPTVSGSYKIVNRSNTLAGNEISVLFGTGVNPNTDAYYSTGTDNTSATVTVGSNGKLKVVIPSFEVEHVNSSGIVGNATASATIVE